MNACVVCHTRPAGSSVEEAGEATQPQIRLGLRMRPMAGDPMARCQAA
jgi:hypothetical protein